MARVSPALSARKPPFCQNVFALQTLPRKCVLRAPRKSGWGRPGCVGLLTRVCPYELFSGTWPDFYRLWCECDARSHSAAFLRHGQACSLMLSKRLRCRTVPVVRLSSASGTEAKDPKSPRTDMAGNPTDPPRQVWFVAQPKR
jgi:hypothetical protein